MSYTTVRKCFTVLFFLQSQTLICNAAFLDENEELQHWIRYYSNQGLEYCEILKFLQKYHYTITSRCTVFRRPKDYHLSRRTGKNLSLETIREARERINLLIEEPASSSGYRSV